MSNIFEAIIVLVTLHTIADYPMQGDFLANIKGKNFFLLMVHSWMWSGIIYFGLMYFGLAQPYDFLQLFIVHTMIDKWKCNRPDKSKALTTDLYIDQAAHMAQITVAVLV